MPDVRQDDGNDGARLTKDHLSPSSSFLHHKYKIVPLFTRR
jgi:hypothetical protein